MADPVRAEAAARGRRGVIVIDFPCAAVPLYPVFRTGDYPVGGLLSPCLVEDGLDLCIAVDLLAENVVFGPVGVRKEGDIGDLCPRKEVGYLVSFIVKYMHALMAGGHGPVNGGRGVEPAGSAYYLGLVGVPVGIAPVQAVFYGLEPSCVHGHRAGRVQFEPEVPSLLDEFAGIVVRVAGAPVHTVEHVQGGLRAQPVAPHLRPDAGGCEAAVVPV